jgi:hypothetical protein
MRKALASMTTISGFTFIIVVAVVGCQIDKVLVLNKSRIIVVPNSFISSEQSLFPPLFKVFIDFLSTFHLGI